MQLWETVRALSFCKFLRLGKLTAIRALRSAPPPALLHPPALGKLLLELFMQTVAMLRYDGCLTLRAQARASKNVYSLL